MEVDQRQRAKRYEAIHNGLFVVETVLTVVVLVAFLASGGSRALAGWARALAPNPWLHVALYGGVAVCASKLLFLPLSYYAEYHLEHQFGLSNETLGGWLRDQLKSLGLNLLLGLIVLDGLYFFLRRVGPWWWVAAGVFFLLFGVVMSVLYPVLILPLFYKLQPLDNASLREKLVALAAQVDAKVLGVYRMGLSEKTKKANAAFAGLGRTKRIILGDTLLDGFAEDEIESVLAHEMAHYQHGDIGKLLAWGTATTFVGLKVADWILQRELARCGFAAIGDIGAFPLLALCLFGFGLVVMPLNNAFSRWRERLADQTALELTRRPDSFIHAMQKLAEQNLADLAPHPVIEFLLHDHPSLARRIAAAEEWQRRRR